MVAPIIRLIESQDIPDIIDLQARTWQDHFLKEKGQRVPLMCRTLKNIEHYLAKEPGGCFVAESDGQIAGSIFSHIWGSVGWFGPLEVEPGFQGRGIGKALVEASGQYISSRGCTTIGLETVAGDARNIAFYTKQGFKPHGISYVFFKKLEWPDLQRSDPVGRNFDRSTDLEGSRALWNRITPDLDYTKEIETTSASHLGKIRVVNTDAGPAHAIIHTYPLLQDSQNAIVKLIVAGQNDNNTTTRLLDWCEGAAIAAGKSGLFLRKYSATPPGPGYFFERGFSLQGMSIRLISQGPDESGETQHISCWSG